MRRSAAVAVSRLLAVIARLPPALTHRVRVFRDLEVPVADGTVLLADRYVARDLAAGDTPPLVLMRTPYGRRGFEPFARLFAERGYQALVQSCRGTSGSGGEFRAFRDEGADGQATVAWLARQPWFDGRLATFGPSYLGFTQWALCGATPPPRAMAIQIAASDRSGSLYVGGSFFLEFALAWLRTLAVAPQPLWRVLIARLREKRALAGAYAHLPLCEADRVAVGRRVDFYQEWLVHDSPADPFWREVDHRRSLESLDAAVSMVAGFHDYFLPSQLADYAALRDAGRPPRLVIGPWRHGELGALAAGLREALALFDSRLRGVPDTPRAPVRVFLGGAKRWLELPDWPPPATAVRFHLWPEGRLATERPPASPPERFTYDPSDPTPSLGGTGFGRDAGVRNNRPLESRADVLVFTSEPLAADLMLVGPVEAELFVRSSVEHTDFFVRLCDVTPRGRSLNVCDGLQRLGPDTLGGGHGAVARVRVALWPASHSFRKGHRLRVQVSGGAHPRFCRNPGSGEPLATATTLVAASQEVLHDPEHASGVVLPVVVLRRGAEEVRQRAGA